MPGIAGRGRRPAPSSTMIRNARAVPAAAPPPRSAALPSGWQASGVAITRGKAQPWLDSNRGPAGSRRNLTATCDTGAEQTSQTRRERTGFERLVRPGLLVPGGRLGECLCDGVIGHG